MCGDCFECQNLGKGAHGSPVCNVQDRLIIMGFERCPIPSRRPEKKSKYVVAFESYRKKMDYLAGSNINPNSINERGVFESSCQEAGLQ